MRTSVMQSADVRNGWLADIPCATVKAMNYVLKTVVKAVGPNAEACGEATIEVSRFLQALGLLPEHFQNWTRRFGADSLGVSPTGEYLLPDYPAISMLGWVDVEPVVMDAVALSALMNECDRLHEITTEPSLVAQCAELRALVLCALNHQLSLDFDWTT